MRIAATADRRARDALGEAADSSVAHAHGVRAIVIDVGLILSAAALFALAHPNPISRWGWWPLAFVALAPLFIVVHRNGFLRSLLYGALYGFVSYALYNYWLATFHPLALIIVPIVHLGYFLLLFPLLTLADRLLPRFGYLVQVLLWVAFEYVKSLGFLGYSFGILGYTQYLWSDFIRIAGVTGVWGVSLLVVTASAILARLAIHLAAASRGSTRDGGHRWRVALGAFARQQRVTLVIYAVLLVANVSYGAISSRDYSNARQWRVALVQQNIDPWRGGFRAYERSLATLKWLSTAALTQDPEVVIWSETSFVPGIDWHTRYRTDPRRFALVRELRDYLDLQTVPFVVGNDDGQLERTENGEVRVDYNASILFEAGEIVGTYRKLHLVPFTESFPFERQLPGIHAWLLAADTHFWKPGEVATVFEVDGVHFSTPICFEDTFGDLNRRFVLGGADVLVNMTNDSWSFSVPAEVQHMMMGVFRAVENRRSVVRSTNGGMTVTIDPNGRIIDQLEPFIDDYLISTVPVAAGAHTLYTRFGDWLGIVVLATAATVLTAAAAFRRKR
jgi:apolipoprotein N-acyltransferase